MNPALIIGIAIGIGFTVAFCAVPVVIAWVRHSPDLKTIAKLSPLTILSFALWFALIVWGWSGKRDDDSVISRYIDKVQEKNLIPWIVGGLVVLGLATSALFFLNPDLSAAFAPAPQGE